MKAYRAVKGILLKWPDLPPMYDCKFPICTSTATFGAHPDYDVDEFSEHIAVSPGSSFLYLRCL